MITFVASIVSIFGALFCGGYVIVLFVINQVNVVL